MIEKTGQLSKLFLTDRKNEWNFRSYLHFDHMGRQLIISMLPICFVFVDQYFQPAFTAQNTLSRVATTPTLDEAQKDAMWI